MDKDLLIKALTKFLLGVIVLGLLLFFPAGSLHYWQGWLPASLSHHIFCMWRSCARTHTSHAP